MPTQEDIDTQQQLLMINRRTIALLLGKAARYGGVIFAPIEVSHGLIETREQIAQIMQTLRGWNVEVEEHPDDVDSRDSPSSDLDIDKHSILSSKKPDANTLHNGSSVDFIEADIDNEASKIEDVELDEQDDSTSSSNWQKVLKLLVGSIVFVALFVIYRLITSADFSSDDNARSYIAILFLSLLVGIPLLLAVGSVVWLGKIARNAFLRSSLEVGWFLLSHNSLEAIKKLIL